jgi:lipopolysaccharide/colanic/teichoic acid biosynthesis glycosyltransferase
MAIRPVNLMAMIVPPKSAAPLAVGLQKTWLASALCKRRWQIILGLALTVALPAFIRWPDSVLTLSSTSLNNALFGTTAAVVLGYFFLRKLAAMPGLKIFSYILPVFSMSYGLMAVLLLVTRQDYSRFQVITSFVIAVAFFYIVFLVERSIKRPRIAVFTSGHTAELMEFDRVDWVIWRSPDQIPYDYDGIVADLRADIGAPWQAFLARCALNGIRVYHSKQMQESLTGRVAIEHLSENTLGSINPSSFYVHLKLAIDVLAATIILPFAALTCGVAAIFIKLDSRGPVLFSQERVGYRGRIFRVYKLRTMQWGAEGADYTEVKDPRITRVGAFLRKFRIDELPQIINVLNGEMSWIGPRPESLPLAEWYERELAFYSYRHIVRPGIAGWAQVQQGNVAKPELAKYKLHFDFYYIKNFSPWLDVVIALMTVRTILTGFGAR